jgi:hypothetical protein
MGLLPWSDGINYAFSDIAATPRLVRETTCAITALNPIDE